MRSFVGEVTSIAISLPPLRQRSDDVRELVTLFSSGRRRWTSEALQVVRRQEWPGNVRELRQFVEVTCASGLRGDVSLAELPPQMRMRSARRHMTRIEEVELSALLAAVQESGGNKARAAEILGVSRSTVYRKLARSSISLDPRTS